MVRVVELVIVEIEGRGACSSHRREGDRGTLIFLLPRGISLLLLSLSMCGEEDKHSAMDSCL
jgi:hypothetical protein